VGHTALLYVGICERTARSVCFQAETWMNFGNAVLSGMENCLCGIVATSYRFAVNAAVHLIWPIPFVFT
jgi:hypothetical protein